MSCSFLSAGLLPPWLDLFLGILFYFFDAMVNGIIFLVSLSDSSLLVSKSTTNFYILIFYPATLLNSLMSSNSFLVASLGFSKYSICHLQTMTVYFFPIWIPFISFSFLIAVARTSNTILNKSGESGHPCLIPDLRGNAFSFLLLNMMLAIGLSYMCVPCIHTLWRVFIVNGC